MRTPLVVANWKMNGSLQLCAAFAKVLNEVPGVDVWLAPPFVYLPIVSKDEKLQTLVAFGAQNVHEERSGAFTGEVSAGMIADLGASFSIIGHSERRALSRENDTIIAQKLQSCLQVGLIPVFCVGESLEQRQNGTAQLVVRQQLQSLQTALKTVEPDRVVVAYEPTWAIGTGVTAKPQDAEDMHRSVRSVFGSRGANLRILYGGSVKPENAKELFGQPNVDGFLVGGASLDPSSFVAICQAVSEN